MFKEKHESRPPTPVWKEERRKEERRKEERRKEDSLHYIKV